MSSSAAKATTLLELHAAPALLKVVNVWDAISAKVIAELDGTKALATASHSIAASYGYEDGENIPVDLMIEAVGRIAAAVSASQLPVSADLEAGYGNPGETTRKASGVGIVGANLEDQMKPLPAAVATVEAVVKAGEAEGVPFVLNARTDVFLKAGDREAVLAEAIKRGKAFLDAGAPVVFFPGKFGERTVSALVEALGPQKVTLIGVPKSLPLAKLEELGVARVSYGPWSQRVALTALADFATDVIGGGGVPEGTRPLN